MSLVIEWERDLYTESQRGLARLNCRIDHVDQVYALFVLDWQVLFVKTGIGAPGNTGDSSRAQPVVHMISPCKPKSTRTQAFFRAVLLDAT